MERGKDNNNRVKKTKYTMIWMTIYQLVLFGSNFILPKIIIEHYGSAYNGMVSSITQFLTIISILRLGLAGPTRVALYDSLANNNHDKTSAIMNATSRFTKKIGIVLVFYIIIMAIIYPVFVNRGFYKIEVSVLVIAIGLSFIGEYFFGLPVMTLLDADQKSYIYNCFLSITLLISTGVSIALIYNSASLQFVKIVSGLMMLVYYCSLSYYTIGKYRINRNISENKEAILKRKDAWGHSIANIVHDNTDILLLTVFCDIKIVSVYSIYALVVNGITRLLNIFSTGSEAIFGNMWAKNEIKSIKEWLSNFEFFIGSFIIIFFSTTFIMIIPFVKLYTKGVNDINYILPLYALLVVVTQAVFCLRIPYISLVQACGKYKETKRGAYSEAIINIMISLALVNILGIYGVTIGTLIANVFRTVQYEIFVRKNITFTDNKSFFKMLIWIIMTSICICVLGMIVIQVINIDAWLNWVIAAACVFVAASLFVLITSYFLYRKNLDALIKIVKKMM